MSHILRINSSLTIDHKWQRALWLPWLTYHVAIEVKRPKSEVFRS